MQKTIIVNGQTHLYKLKASAIRSFEEQTGASVFKIDGPTLASVKFADLMSFIIVCAPTVSMDVLDDLEFEEVMAIFSELITGKKRETVPAVAMSDSPHTDTVSLRQNGQEPQAKTTPTSASTSTTSPSEEEREKILSD